MLIEPVKKFNSGTFCI